MNQPVPGSKYNGVQFDRPALRQLPRGWQLEGVHKAPPWWRQMVIDLLVAVVVLAWALMIIAQVLG